MHEIVFERAAAKMLAKLPRDAQLRIQAVVETLARTPRPPAATKLAGSSRSLWRVRSGDYRVIYEINEGKLLILVVAVGNRRDIYSRLRG
ncbi:type II toxin-antitoxin system RelE/ParE family toxin [Paeniglutamicibacter gangotriensis]|uniref:Type II toxin-antitoxin system RelE/ParE family toxin n=1 Tax=Paeniglutamicibacter gangotriensis TaxID=254787 RepID=A0A5B0EDN1_9MICC|nr:type II toxin-antitoxin system RelE/ParE family toxin [Paeniglutamicibacter gangotriensis]KAA0975951.1 type II toxin-antitoxin system RelE/ParE family toxin [Paeniglutamicibacter gangotriensis]